MYHWIVLLCKKAILKAEWYLIKGDWCRWIMMCGFFLIRCLHRSLEIPISKASKQRPSNIHNVRMTFGFSMPHLMCLLMYSHGRILYFFTTKRSFTLQYKQQMLCTNNCLKSSFFRQKVGILGKKIWFIFQNSKQNFQS